jgi:hypothetical protein
MGEVQVDIQVLALNEHCKPSDAAALSQFLMAGIEAGMSAGLKLDVMAFDPHTGEPLYNVNYPRAEVNAMIAHVTVASPAAMLAILQNQELDDDVGQVEPAIIEPLWDE